MFNLDGDGDLGGSDISDDPDITRFKYVYSILFIYKEVPIIIKWTQLPSQNPYQKNYNTYYVLISSIVITV